MAETGRTLTPRSFDTDDIGDVVDLINADRMPGQPLCTAAMLSEAVAGRSLIDSGWWAELDQVAVDVLCDRRGTIHGAVSYARRAHEDTAAVLWLHGREEPAAVNALLDRAVVQLKESKTLDAFEFASALTVGLEGLPVRHRPATRTALLAYGFAESDLWRYMRRELPATELPQAPEPQILADPDHPGWRIETLAADGTKVGEAQVSIAASGLGVLWWIAIEQRYRGSKLGRPLLGSALDLLHQHGAHEVILFVDDDAPPQDPERGRGPANALYDRAGFVQIDRLCSYRRSS